MATDQTANANGDLQPTELPDRVDEAVDESFPASDPPARTSTTGSSPKRESVTAAAPKKPAPAKTTKLDAARRTVADLKFALERAKILVQELAGDDPARKKPKAGAAVPPALRTPDLSKAAGKQHRKPPMNLRGVKHSKLSIAKAKTGKELRRRSRG